MRVAVVILNWNGESFLRQFLPTVLQHSGHATVYVADNASTDGSVQLIRQQFPEVKLIENGGNLGFAGGYNAALQGLNEDLYVLLNSDVEVSAGWMDPVVELMAADPTLAACQPKVLQYAQKDHFEYAGAAGGFIDRFGFPFCRGRIFDTLEQDNGQYDEPVEIFWATGACMFVRSSVYHELGGLDADFFAHMEEIDLCWRMKRAGYRIMVQPRSVVYHVGGGTLSRSNPHKTFLNFRNGLMLLAKNLHSRQLIPILFTRMVLDGIAAIRFLLAGKPKDLLAVLKAHMAFYRSAASTLKKRSGNYPQISCIYLGSIVLAYFLRRIDRFSRLRKDAFSTPEPQDGMS